MSVISLSPSTRLESFPKPRPKPMVADGQLDDIRSWFHDTEKKLDGELNHANQAFEKINAAKGTVNGKINATDTLQKAWGNYRTIVGTAILVLIGVHVSETGWMLWKWFKAKRDNKEIPASQLDTREGQDTDPFEAQFSRRRLHAREWNVSRT
jgi:hypothetical protein